MSSVKAKKETCLKCGSTELENLVRIEEGQPPKVYVRCAKCRSFVARDILSEETCRFLFETCCRHYPGGSAG